MTPLTVQDAVKLLKSQVTYESENEHISILGFAGLGAHERHVIVLLHSSIWLVELAAGSYSVVLGLQPLHPAKGISMSVEPVSIVTANFFGGDPTSISV